MSKFSQEQIDWVKRELKLVDLAQGAGLELRRKNGQFVTGAGGGAVAPGTTTKSRRCSFIQRRTCLTVLAVTLVAM